MNNGSFEVRTSSGFDRSFKKLNNWCNRQLILQWITRNLSNSSSEHIYMLADQLKTGTGMDYAFKVGVYHLISRIEYNKIILLECVDHTISKEVGLYEQY